MCVCVGVTGERLIGYQTRLENRVTASCQITYCTTGVFLRALIENTDSCLKGLTHIVIDQVHEKDGFINVLMGVLGLRLVQYPHLRMVLLSADQEPYTELLARYFQSNIIQIRPTSRS